MIIKIQLPSPNLRQPESNEAHDFSERSSLAIHRSKAPSQSGSVRRFSRIVNGSLNWRPRKGTIGFDSDHSKCKRNDVFFYTILYIV